ncbi:hypothetical protein [Stieleria varia]|uniref:hypothetical protein n=1 Tax=Stieleria varia TaxID=2528005 RepID=UPI0011B5CFFE|nr:hypothetical protein [Stieleria varia]
MNDPDRSDHDSLLPANQSLRGYDDVGSDAEHEFVPLRDEFPELYGQMLVANEQISNAGTLSIWILLFANVLICVGIHKAWVAAPLGIPVANLQSWGVYLLITIFFIIVFSMYTTYAEKAAYRRMRDSIEAELRKQRQTFPWLLAQIHGDESLKSLAEQLRGDLGTLHQ